MATTFFKKLSNKKLKQDELLAGVLLRVSAHSVPAYITYCYGIALNKQILYCRPKRTSDGLGRLTKCRLRFHLCAFRCPMKHSASGLFFCWFSAVKNSILFTGKAVNALHQRFSSNIIFTATTFDLKHTRNSRKRKRKINYYFNQFLL